MDTELNGVVFVGGALEARRRKARGDWTSIKVSLVIFGVLIIIGLPPAWAQSGESELKPNAPPEAIWMDGIGSGFRKGTLQAGGTLGAGFGTKVFETELIHDLALASVNFGWVFTNVVAHDKWYRGNWELLAEVFGGLQFHPNDRYFFGVTPLIRYNFATGSRWVPFLDGGAGLSGTNIGGVDLTGTFQFNVQVGAGIHYFLSDRTALTVQYRWLHFSNANTDLPNHGTNTQMFLAGVSWFF
jgi:lipid A 3-O-deacylase